MTKEELEMAYKSEKINYEKLMYYKKLFDNAYNLQYQINYITNSLENIHHIDIYENSCDYIRLSNIPDVSQEPIKKAFVIALEETLKAVNKVLEDTKL